MTVTKARYLLESGLFADLLKIGIRTGQTITAGSHSFTWGQNKFLLSTVCHDWPSLDGEIYPHTPGEAARVELQRAWPKLKRVGWPGPFVKLLRYQAPMFYTGPQQVDRAYLIDVKSAYVSIYRKLWLDTCYPRGQGSLCLCGVADRLSDWKAARNSVIGIIRSTRVTQYHGGRYRSMAIKNSFLSPGLWGTITEILSELANEASQLSCVYWNTDGGIFTSENGAKSFLALLDDVGLKYSIAMGPADIRGWNNYRVGQKETYLYKRGESGGGVPFQTQLPPRNERSFLKWWSGLTT